VPSFDHDILVELFRRRGELAAALLQSCAGIAIDHVRAELGSIDLSQVASIEYRADAVSVLRDLENRAVMGVLVEIQRGIDRKKRLTWPVYVAALRAELDCAVVLLVIAPDRKVAAWARAPIELGHPGFQLRPVVIGFDDVPRIYDRVDARRLPELAVLSAMAHPELEVAQVAIEAISHLPEDQSRLYFDVVLSAAPAAIRQVLEAQMQGYKYQSEFAIRYYSQGEAAGLEKGLQAAALALARGKLEALTDADVAAIEVLHDHRVLTELITALGDARNAEEARVAFDLAVG
jgi:hypothetical protein